MEKGDLRAGVLGEGRGRGGVEERGVLGEGGFRRGGFLGVGRGRGGLKRGGERKFGWEDATREVG